MDSQQEEEKFVIKWGKEMLANRRSASTSKKGEELKNVKQYGSFLLEGTRFRLGDTVYLQASDGPPYIGKILSMYEGKKKGMHVRWFCRPSELPEGLPDVDYNEGNKEIFMCSGTAGAKNVVDPASTIKKCSVVCTAEEDWNSTPPSSEQVAASDHVLKQAYDINSNVVRSLKTIARQFGESYVTGALPRATGEWTSALHQDRDGLKPGRSRQLESEQAMKGFPRGKPSSAGLPEARTKLLSEHGLPDSEQKVPIWSLETEYLKIKKRQEEDKEQVNCKRPKLNGAADVSYKKTVAWSDQMEVHPGLNSSGFRSTASTGDDEPYVPRKKFFNNPPWEQLVERAVEKGQALHLQNLDPNFSSWEIEEMLQQLLRVHCDVRMLPPKDFSSYTSGEALVVFEACSIAEDAFLKLTENILIWSKDERPVVATIARKQMHTVNPFYGFLDLDKFSARNSYRQQKKNATSHCSQPNTVEYEMGIQWRLVKDRQTETWRIAEQMHQEKINTLALQHKLS